MALRLLSDGPFYRKPLPSPYATELFHHLYLFLSQLAAEDWIQKLMESSTHFSRTLFWQIHMTQLEVGAWCKTNESSLSDDAIDSLQAAEDTKSRMKSWRDVLENPQVIA
jgi:hypothetical protein